jgi:hypothetical protein
VYLKAKTTIIKIELTATYRTVKVVRKIVPPPQNKNLRI